MQRPSEPPELDVAAVTAAFEARALAAAPDQAVLATELIRRLQPDHWTLEWYLPWWLGQSLAVDPAICGDIVLGNVLGLASLRLRDDLADGEIRPADEPGARALSDALYAEAMALFRERFGETSPLWAVLARSMAQWDVATLAHALRPAGSRRHRPRLRRFDVIARRGAPLKVCASALCLLADRPDIVPRLDAAIDHALAAWILFDDANDWPADIAAGRWNAFVARVAIEPQETSRPDELHTAVIMAMLTTDRTQRYFSTIRRAVERSASIADEVGLRPLAEHVRAFGAHAARRGEQVQNHYHALTERATVLMFGDASG